MPRVLNLVNTAEKDPMGLPSGKLPNTIEDAILATKFIGYRYLWIDRYCIPQQEGPEKQAQITKMDMVYANAEVTIAAAAGIDSEYGLPGVGSVSRVQQTQCQILQYDLVGTLPCATRVVKSSRWWTRAWTYQEAVLSRRLLIFTDFQVYFECRSMNCTEDVDHPLPLLHTKHQEHFREIGDDTRIFQWKGAERQGDIGNRIAEYSKRDLTYTSDALNAMFGILRAMEDRSPPLRHFWGVPVSSEPGLWFLGKTGTWKTAGRESAGVALMTGLCWTLIRPAERRLGFPSWSWTGWEGAVDPKCSDSFGWRAFEEAEDEVVHVEIENVNGDVLEWSKFLFDPSSRKQYFEFKPYLYLDAVFVALRFQYLEKPPDGFGQPMTRDKSHEPGFWAVFEVQDPRNPSSQLALSGAAERWTEAYAPLRLTKMAPLGSAFHKKLGSKVWDSLVVSNRNTYSRKTRSGEFWNSDFLLVLEEHDDGIAERVSSVDLADTLAKREISSRGRHYTHVFNDRSPIVQQRRKRIVLG